MKEVWKQVPGFEGLYEVSNTGVVKALKRTWVTGKNLTRNKDEHYLKPAMKQNGYYHVHLTKNGVALQVPVHRLVAEAFLPNQEKKKCVNHKDGNKTNNNLYNLSWATYKENNDHALKNGLRINPSGEKNGYSVPVRVKVNGVDLGLFNTLREVASKLNMSYDVVYRLSVGRTKKRAIEIERVL
jgi:hypothetical protein